MDPARVLEDLLASAGRRGVLHGAEVIFDWGDPDAESEAFAAGAALADVGNRTHVELSGEDRATFLHNLCTNDIRRLTPGQGCEAFFLDSLGRVLAYAFVFVGERSIVLDTVPGQGAAIVAHLERYLIRERVELRDRTGDWGELLLAGPKAEEMLTAAGVELAPPGPVACTTATLAGETLIVCRAPLVTGGAYLMAGRPVALAEAGNALRSAGASAVGYAAVEAERIVAGSPWYGVDITAKTLPQEVARDAQAISFTKGCYIGQETVARLDARGHVNKTLCGLELATNAPPRAGSPLLSDGVEVGHVTSAAYVPRLARARALAYLRSGANQVGTTIESESGAARVAELPASTRR